MEQDSVRESALRLVAALDAQRNESPVVADLHHSMKPLLDAALAGTLAMPVPWHDVPCNYPFMEGDYAAFPEVEEAYARFKMQVTGSASVLEQLWKAKP